MLKQSPDVTVLDLAQVRLVFAGAVGQQLGEGERRRLGEQLNKNAAGREYVHGRRQIARLHRRVLVARRHVAGVRKKLGRRHAHLGLGRPAGGRRRREKADVGGVCHRRPRLEPLGRDVARAPARGVEEVGKVGRVVLRQVSGFEGGEVGEDDPIPTGDHDVFQLDVAVANVVLVGLLHGQENLERHPLLLNQRQEGPGADPVVQAVLDELAHDEASAFRHLQK